MEDITVDQIESSHRRPGTLKRLMDLQKQLLEVEASYVQCASPPYPPEEFKLFYS